MTIARVTSGDHYAVGSEAKGFHNPCGVNAGTAHSSYNAKVRFDLVSAYAGQIAAGVCTPVAAKDDNLGLEFIFHHLVSHILYKSEYRNSNIKYSKHCYRLQGLVN